MVHSSKHPCHEILTDQKLKIILHFSQELDISVLIERPYFTHPSHKKVNDVKTKHSLTACNVHVYFNATSHNSFFLDKAIEILKVLLETIIGTENYDPMIGTELTAALVFIGQDMITHQIVILSN